MCYTIIKMSQIHSQHLGNYYVPEECKGGVCVDIGGNTGQFSIKYAGFFRFIHIYEPQSACYNIIRDTVLSKFKNISLLPEAVYHTSNMKVDLMSHHNLDSGSVAVRDEIIIVPEWTSNIVDNKCNTISLIDIINRIGGKVDYMKIDCETSEYNLLIGNDLSNIKQPRFELHWQMGKNNFELLVNHILKYFDNVFSADLTYPIGYNIEVYFKNKNTNS